MCFVRVKDKSTGHEFDVPESDPRINRGFFIPVKPNLYPRSSRVRRPKYNVGPIPGSVDPTPPSLAEIPEEETPDV